VCCWLRGQEEILFEMWISAHERMSEEKQGSHEMMLRNSRFSKTPPHWYKLTLQVLLLFWLSANPYGSRQTLGGMSMKSSGVVR